MPWTIDILSLDGSSTERLAAPFRSARVTWAADGTGALEIDLRQTDVAAGDWLWGRRRLLVKDSNEVARYQGWLDRLERGGSPGTVRFRAASRGLAAILDQRVVHGDFSEVDAAATDIAVALLGHIAAQTDDATGFTEGTITGEAPDLTRHFCDGDVISTALDDLATYFAWEIDAAGKFNAWVGGRGTDLSDTITLSPTAAIDWSCIGDVTEMATYCTGIGDYHGSQPCGPPLVVDFTPERVDYGRREVVITDDAEDEFTLEDKTAEELRARVASRIHLSTSWVEGHGPWAFGDVWIGDVVNAELGDEFGGDHDVRLINITASLEPGKHEFIEYEWEAA